LRKIVCGLIDGDLMVRATK